MGVDTLGQVAAEIAMRAAAAYLDQHNLEADTSALVECLRSWCKAKLPEAMRLAKEAIEAHMDKPAEMLFRLTMAEAGVEAAKEAGLPKRKEGTHGEVRSV